MTSLVALQCKDGVVVAADSAATFAAAGSEIRTVEQPTEQKIKIVGDRMIVAASGYVGHAQRLNALIETMFRENAFGNADALSIGQIISRRALEGFAETHVNQLALNAFVAYTAGRECALCEFPAGSMHPSQPTAFQPELKKIDDLWFVSAGSGQLITDSFLALFRDIFWADAPPDLSGGKFTAYWALKHACDVNPGGVKEPIHMAVLAKDPHNRGQHRAWMLNDDEKSELAGMVNAATEHMRGFKAKIEGAQPPEDMPKPKDG